MDIFCHVIDNYGDAGVVYRFAKQWSATAPQCRVRVFIDDIAVLAKLVPGVDPLKPAQEYSGITFYRSDTITPELIERIGAAEVLIEAFACHIPEPVLEAASMRPTVIINLEYFSAEPWIEGYHLKESLLGRGKLKKYFYMPGITKDSGGLILGSNIAAAQQCVERDRFGCLNAILRPYKIAVSSGAESIVGTIFTYLRGFDSLLADLQLLGKEAYILVFGEKSAQGMRRTLERIGIAADGLTATAGSVHIAFMSFLPQDRYDELLCAADFNIVRGEDSLARAILSGRPFLWQAYIQENKYHLIKVQALSDRLSRYFDDTAASRRYHHLLMEFNGMEREEPLQVTGERYDLFLGDLNKIGHATRQMSYFIRENCNLVKKLSEFLHQL